MHHIMWGGPQHQYVQDHRTWCEVHRQRAPHAPGCDLVKEGSPRTNHILTDCADLCYFTVVVYFAQERIGRTPQVFG